MDAALQGEEDRAILKRCRSPRDVFEFLGKWYDPENEVATQHLFDKFNEFSIPQNSSPIAALHALKDINNQMEEKGTRRIPDTVLHARFVRALPAEYEHAKETLQSMKNGTGTRSSAWSARGTPTYPKRRGRSARPDRLNMCSSRTKVEGGVVHDGVAVATPGAAGAAAVAGTAVVEMATAAPVVLAVIQVAPKEAVEATTAPVTVGVAATEVIVIRPPAVVGAAGGGATRKRGAPRRRAISCPGAPGAQALPTRRVPAHQTRRY